MKKLKIVLFVIFLFLPSFGFNAQSNGERLISVETIHSTYVGTHFIANISFFSPTPLLVMQCDISYNPRVIHAIKIMDGGAFEGWGGSIAPWLIKIDNQNGTIKNVFAYSPNGTSSGTFSFIEFKGISPGKSWINITNVTAGDKSTIPVEFRINNASIVISAYPWDLNMDGKIDLKDLMLIAGHWMETGTPGWIREDVNKDGVINIFDLIIVARHYGE